jgi:uncharacterized membrane protein
MRSVPRQMPAVAAAVVAFAGFAYSSVVTAHLQAPGEATYEQWQAAIPWSNLALLIGAAALVVSEVLWIGLAHNAARTGHRAGAIMTANAALVTAAAPVVFFAVVVPHPTG